MHTMPPMRLLVVVLALSACAGPVRPAVMQNMENLPTDPQRRSQQLDSAAATPSAESRRGLSDGEKKAETVAATAAAFIGALFSSRVPGSGALPFLFGAASPSEEMLVVDPHYEARKKAAKREKDEEQAKDEQSDPAETDAERLVPWITIRPGD